MSSNQIPTRMCSAINMAQMAIEVATGKPVRLWEITDMGPSWLKGTLLIGEFRKADEHKLSDFVCGDDRIRFVLGNDRYDGTYAGHEIRISKVGDPTTWVGTHHANRRAA